MSATMIPARKRKRDDSIEEPEDSGNDSFKAFMSTWQHKPDFSDLTLRCEGQEFHVHRLVVVPQSTWFAEKCAGSLSNLPSPQEITLDGKPGLAKLLVTYLYNHDYSDTGKHNLMGKDIPPLRVNANVYKLAEKYGIAKLKTLAASKTRSLLRNGDRRGLSETINDVLASKWTQDRSFQDLLLEKFLAVREEVAEEDQRVLANEGSTPWVIRKTWCETCKLEEEVSCYMCKSKKVTLNYDIQR